MPIHKPGQLHVLFALVIGSSLDFPYVYAGGHIICHDLQGQGPLQPNLAVLSLLSHWCQAFQGRVLLGTLDDRSKKDRTGIEEEACMW
jgi:hypothetical protein